MFVSPLLKLARTVGVAVAELTGRGDGDRDGPVMAVHGFERAVGQADSVGGGKDRLDGDLIHDAAYTTGP